MLCPWGAGASRLENLRLEPGWGSWEWSGRCSPSPGKANYTVVALSADDSPVGTNGCGRVRFKARKPQENLALRPTPWEARTRHHRSGLLAYLPATGPLQTPTMTGTDFLGNLLGTRVTASQTQREAPRRERGAAPQRGLHSHQEKKEESRHHHGFTVTHGWSRSPPSGKSQRPSGQSYYPVGPQDGAQPAGWGSPPCHPGASGCQNGACGVSPDNSKGVFAMQSLLMEILVCPPILQGSETRAAARKAGPLLHKLSFP
ncbi:uncharacterized protein LOC115294829 [Suricata suricatta]|uniref:uncharacterized protein LOC115294829 n=1 Tax=Suricata suricatta TaxID=37032 RepID=UPI001155AF10|nr:uncharacterized protein LOC115294829 [Suricata suricatta]